MLEGGKSAEGCTAASAGIFWSLSIVNRPHAADSAEGQGLRCAGGAGAGGAVFVFNVQKNQNNEKAPRVSLKVRETEVTLRLSLI